VHQFPLDEPFGHQPIKANANRSCGYSHGFFQFPNTCRFLLAEQVDQGFVRFGGEGEHGATPQIVSICIAVGYILEQLLFYTSGYLKNTAASGTNSTQSIETIRFTRYKGQLAGAIRKLGAGDNSSAAP